MGVMSAGALTGAGLIAVWVGRGPDSYAAAVHDPGWRDDDSLRRGTDPRPAGIAVFMVVLPLPMGGALYKSLLQAKTRPICKAAFCGHRSDGRATAPLSFLITGPLVDRLVEPAVGGRGWSLVEPLVGGETGPGWDW